MRYGRTSMVNFLSSLAMSFSGFVTTIVLTRTLGRDSYGTYVVVLSVLAWMAIAGNLGLSQAIKKRVSESSSGNYVVSGALVQIGLYAVVAVCLWTVRPYLNAYMEIDATGILILLLAVRLLGNFVQTVLDGQHLVHVSSILTPVEWTGRSLVQVALVLSGFGIAGAFAGYVVGGIVAAIIGFYFLSFDLALPERRDFTRLKSYAQFSWLASVKGRTFRSMDTLVLAIFVPNGLIAIYEVAWNLASLFSTFGTSISRTLFPEMSGISSVQGANEEISDLLNVSLAYSGLFIIPGLLGSAIVGDVVLTIYGPGFKTGYYILLILTVARLIHVYQKQFVTVLDGVNRPDLTFRINGTFIGVNLVLNLLLTWQYGWYGAAIATTASTVLGLALGYYYASQIVDVDVPGTEIVKQALAATVMAIVVRINRTIFGDSIPLVVALVCLGVGVYFGVLFTISATFRTTVKANLPKSFYP